MMMIQRVKLKRSSPFSLVVFGVILFGRSGGEASGVEDVLEGNFDLQKRASNI
jgi:hypothetical protein